MPTTQVQFRRGTSTQLGAMTPAEGEVVVDMTNDRISVGDGVRAGGFAVPNFSDIQKNSFGFGTAAGTANALTLSLSPPLLSYVAGTTIEFIVGTTNTGAATINVNGLGAIAFRKVQAGSLAVLSAGDLISGVVYKATYNGTYFQLSSSGSGGGFSQVVSAGNYPISSRLAQRTATSVSGFATHPSRFYIPYDGVIRLNSRITGNNNGGQNQWLRNGVLVSGTTHTVAAFATTSFQDSVSVSAGDLIQFQYRTLATTTGSPVEFDNMFVSTSEYVPSVTLF